MESNTKYASAVIVVCLIIPVLLAGSNIYIGSEAPYVEDISAECHVEMISISEGRMSDRLKEAMLTEEGDVRVIVLLNYAPEDGDIANFEDHGGVLRKGPWEDAIYGFAGDIPLSNAEDYAYSCDRILEVEKEGEDFEYHLYISSNMVRARNYVYPELGYTGSGDTSLAIIDTGIDASHIAFAPGYLGKGDFDGKIVGWGDASGGSSTPRDSGGHGTHCAAIAVGNQFAEIDEDGRLVTHHGWSTTLGSIEYPEPPVIYVDKPGELEINFAYLAQVNSGHISYIALKYLGENPVPAQFDANTQFIVNWEEVARLTGLTQTSDIRTTTNRNWNTLTYDVDETELGYYRVVTYRTAVSADIGQGLRYVFKIHTPTTWVDEYGNAPDGYGTFTGIAPDAKLTVISGGMFVSPSTWISGLDYINTNRASQHITAVTMSLGTGSDQSSVRSAISTTWNNGIMIIAAAGNDGPTGSMSYPGRYSPVIGVAATQAAGNLSYFSSRGVANNGDGYTKPDIAAPGGSIRFQGGVMAAGAYSGYPPTQWGRVPTEIESMYAFQGTSQATPAVAGATQLIIDALGGWEEYNSDVHYYKRLVKSSLLMSATETAIPREMHTFASGGPSINRGAPDIHEGHGFMNIDAAIESVTRELNIIQNYNDHITTIAYTHEDGFDMYNNYGRKAWAGYVELEAGEDYDFYLDVPSTGDFDLYLYGQPDTFGYPELVDVSNTPTMGADEHISYTPSEAGTYFVVVKGVFGQGNFQFSYTAPGYLGVTLTRPNGGEVWEIGSQEEITWTTHEGYDPVESVDLWYSTDSGSSWTVIDSEVPDTGSYLWTVPDVVSLECRIRVLVRDTGGMTNTDISDGDFAILGDPVQVELTRPNGGEVWTADAFEMIEWTTDEGDNTIVDIDLWYSLDGGGSWEELAFGLPDTGSHSWQVPNYGSDECLVRVGVNDDLGLTHTDQSEGYFTIVAIPPLPPSNLAVEHYGEDELEVPFDEDFTGVSSGSIPSGWTRTSTWWGASTTNEAGGEAPELRFGNLPSGSGVFRCYTPAIDTSDFDTLNLTFRHYYNSFMGSITLRVQTSTDGSSWSDVWAVSTSSSIPAQQLDFLLDHTHGVGSSTLRVSFTVDGSANNMRRWAVDDVTLYTLVTGDGTEHNLITWDASPDDPAEVSEYNLYRSEFYEGPWDESTRIASINAQGLSEYSYIDFDKGTEDAIAWWYVVRAVGINNVEDENADAVQEPHDGPKDEVELDIFPGGDAAGWNFVSFNLIPTTSSLETILSDIEGSYDRVMYYDASVGSWSSYVPGRAERYNNLGTWNHRMGLWIRAVVQDTLTVEGTAPTSTDITLHPGWNMVGLPSESAGNHGLPLEIDRIGYFHAGGTNVAYSYAPDSFVFEPLKGYWVHNPTGGALVWTIEY